MRLYLRLERVTDGQILIMRDRYRFFELLLLVEELSCLQPVSVSMGVKLLKMEKIHKKIYFIGVVFMLFVNVVIRQI